MIRKLYNTTTDDAGELLAITYVVMTDDVPTLVKEVNINNLIPEEVELIKTVNEIIRLQP